MKQNEQRIATMGDLYLHTLETEFGGCATVKEFARRLKRCGLMEENVQKFLKGQDPRVVI